MTLWLSKACITLHTMLVSLPLLLHAVTVNNISVPTDKLLAFFHRQPSAVVTRAVTQPNTSLQISPSPASMYQAVDFASPNPQFVHRQYTPRPRASITTSTPKPSVTPSQSSKPSSSPSVAATAGPSTKPTSTPVSTPKPTLAPTPKPSLKPSVTPTPTPKPQTPSPTAQSDIAQMEQRVLDLTNQERAKNGLSPLSGDSKIAQVARDHSQDMINRHYFEHTTPDGVTFDKRLSNAGIPFHAAAENIALNQSAEAAVTAWMNSAGHRANILNGNYHKLGVGIAKGTDGYYFTQDFTD